MGGVQYTSGRWTWGVDFSWFDTKQELPEQDSGGGRRDRFGEVRGRRSELHVLEPVRKSSSTGSWTTPRWRSGPSTSTAIRTLAELSGGQLGLQLGLRFADFDNDYRAMVGVVNSNGLRIDASSNYGRMMGPLVGVVGDHSGWSGYL